MSLHVPLGLRLLLQLLLEAVAVILTLPQLGGELQLLPRLLSKQLLMSHTVHFAVLIQAFIMRVEYYYRSQKVYLYTNT